MKPKKPQNHPDLFRSQLSQIINMEHALVRLSKRINWERLEAKIDTVYSEGSGQPPLPTRLLVGLHYLKHAFDESDESVVLRWVENPYWQYFCGFEFLQHELPLHPTSMSRWRKRVGVERLDAMLAETILVAKENRIAKPAEFHHVNVDTTVQEKNITFPTDAKLYQNARIALVELAKDNDIKLRQSYERTGKKSFAKHSRYRHASQYKRAKRELKSLKNYLGRVLRELQRKLKSPTLEAQQLLEKAEKIYRQKRNDKNKIYSVHEDAVYCIAKGKAHKRYEFGNKVSIVCTSKSNWILSAQGLENPYDGHTLEEALAHANALSNTTPKHVYCDKGYKGHKQNGPGKPKVHLDGRLPKTLSRTDKAWRKRRAAIEPTIGHLKSDNRMGRNYLKGKLGNEINPVLAAAGYNLRKLLAWFSFVLKIIAARTAIVHYFSSSIEKNNVRNSLVLC